MEKKIVCKRGDQIKIPVKFTAYPTPEVKWFVQYKKTLLDIFFNATCKAITVNFLFQGGKMDF